MGVESHVGTMAGLSSAQRQVLTAVKRRGEASADEVAEMLGITPSAVRQHLAILRTGGLVASRQERGRPGRPADLYHSTELGEHLFAAPTTGEFSVELLRHIEDEDPDLIPRLFQRRRRGRVERYREQLAGKTLGDTVASLAAILDAEGYMADVDRPRATATDSPCTAVRSGRSPPITAWRAPPSSSSCRRSFPTRTSPG